MATEIERKFLLRSDAWRTEVDTGERIRQGYLSRGADGAVRVRLRGARAELNIKSSHDGVHRLEFEYEIPASDAEELLDRVALRPFIEKTRYRIVHGAHVWEIDEFFGDNEGLVLAEIELGSADESFERPGWLGEEVSTDIRYYNTSLSERPFKAW